MESVSATSEEDDMTEKPDPTWSVEDERAERERTGHKLAKTPDVITEGGEPTSPSEEQSDKSWSRASDENIEREARS